MTDQASSSTSPFKPDVVIRRGAVSIEISNTATEELLNKVFSMLNDAVGFEKIFIATGYTDLRRGIDGLASTIKFQFDLDPFQKHILFLFCGKRTDRIKGLVWEGDGFLLLYKRLNIGGFSWPRTKEEAMEITPEQFQMLMQGLSIVAKYPIKELKDPPKTM